MIPWEPCVPALPWQSLDKMSHLFVSIVHLAPLLAMPVPLFCLFSMDTMYIYKRIFFFYIFFFSWAGSALFFLIARKYFSYLKVLGLNTLL